MENSREERNARWNREAVLLPHDRLIAATILPFIPARIRPNHFTVLRMLLTPVVVFFLWRNEYSIGVPLFFATALTDMVDGSLARVRKQITEWGIIHDPIADKLLIGSVLFLIVLEHVNYALGWAVLAVEAVIVGGTFLRRRKGIVTPANVWGKIKMIAEVLGITLLLMALWLDVSLLVDISVGTLAVAVVVAILSLLPNLHK